MIEVHQNQPGLHAAVLFTVRPSCLDHAMSRSKVSHHCRGDTDFLQRYQLFLSSAFHFTSLHSIEKLIGSSQTASSASRACTARVHAPSVLVSSKVHIRARHRCVVFCLSFPSVFAWLAVLQKRSFSFQPPFSSSLSFSRECRCALLRVCPMGESWKTVCPVSGISQLPPAAVSSFTYPSGALD